MNKHKGLLIYPPNQLMDIETPRPDFSLGLLYIASALEEKRIPTDILDASIGTPEQSLKDTFYRKVRQKNGLIRIGMNFQEIAEYVKKQEYTFVGISSNFTPQTTMAFETAKAIKELNPDVKIFAGGINAKAMKEKFLNTSYFDGICLTEGEIIFPKMVLENLENIAGVAYKKDGKIIVNAIDDSCFPEHLDDLPMPAWNKLPFEKFKNLRSHGIDVTEQGHMTYAPLMTSRGCRFHCAYCHISTEKQNTGKLRLHSIERVKQEINKLKELGVKKVYFEDDTLLAKKKRVKEIFKFLKDKDLTIMNVNGVNLIDFHNTESENNEGKWEIDKEYLQILKDAGFAQMVFPSESGCQRILQKYASNKVNLEKMDLPLLMKTMTEMGIKAPVNMMIGFPDETEEEMQESIDLAKKLKEAGAPYVTFFIPIPFPGSKLFEIAIQKGHIDANFNPDIFNWKHAMMKNTTVSGERLEEIRDKANEDVNSKAHVEKRIKNSAGYGLN